MKSFGEKKIPRGYSLTFLNAFQKKKKKPSLNTRLCPRMTNRPTFVTTA